MSTSSTSNYDKYPVVKVASSRESCDVGWRSIAERLQSKARPGRFVVCVECYPGCFEADIERELVAALQPVAIVCANECYRSENAILSQCEPDLGDDPVFGFMNRHVISDFMDEREVGKKRQILSEATGLVLAIGTGSSLIVDAWDVLVYAFEPGSHQL